ncbi:unnamed protein product [Prorocentrum cordatum]|uniref:Uncharacterized protein n=1 Tax=Prorocentrum cordatum TaxID=2364126 RepID=A0ABN9VSF4_9DINO|nr:unnamed protein product [Polarella glacialis]
MSCGFACRLLPPLLAAFLALSAIQVGRREAARGPVLQPEPAGLAAGGQEEGEAGADDALSLLQTAVAVAQGSRVPCTHAPCNVGRAARRHEGHLSEAAPDSDLLFHAFPL